MSDGLADELRARGTAARLERRRPGWVLFTALALATAAGFALALVAFQGAATARRHADARANTAASALCKVESDARAAFVDLLNRLTAPRLLAAGATPTQEAAQSAANLEASEYRASALAGLSALQCGALAKDGAPVPLLLPAPPIAPVAAGPAGAAGANGLTGPQGAAGAPGATGPVGPVGATGPAGSAGSNGAAGANGTNGTNGGPGPSGPTGPPGPQGPPAPTTTTTIAPPTTTTTAPAIAAARKAHP